LTYVKQLEDIAVSKLSVSGLFSTI